MKSKLKWISRIIFGIVAVVILFIAFVYVYENTQRKSVLKKYPLPGQMVDLGTHKIHVRIIGEGNVTILMDAGAGELGSYGYLPIETKLATYAKVVLYDRAGCNWSEKSNTVRNPDNIAKELHEVVKQLGITGPVVLVGHSQGGLNMMRYASLFREEVNGLVLLDAAHPEAYAKIPADVKQTLIKAQGSIELVNLMAKMGFLRLMMPPDAMQLPEPVKGTDNKALALLLTDFFPQTMNNCIYPEHKDGVVNSGLTMDDLFLDSLPVRILSASGSMIGPHGAPPGWNEELEAKQIKYWTEMQQGLLQLSTNSKQEVLPEAGHGMHFKEPGPVIKHILELVEIAMPKTDSLSLN